MRGCRPSVMPHPRNKPLLSQHRIVGGEQHFVATSGEFHDIEDGIVIEVRSRR